jgi:hypothetical protein
MYIRCPAPGCVNVAQIPRRWSVPPGWVQIQRNVGLSRPCCSAHCLMRYMEAQERGLALPSHFFPRAPVARPIEERPRGRRRDRKRPADQLG